MQMCPWRPPASSWQPRTPGNNWPRKPASVGGVQVLSADTWRGGKSPVAGEWLLACLPHPWHFQGHKPLEQDELVAGTKGKGSRGRPMRNRPGPRMQTTACSFTHSKVWAAHPEGPCALELTAWGGIHLASSPGTKHCSNNHVPGGTLFSAPAALGVGIITAG